MFNTFAPLVMVILAEKSILQTITDHSLFAFIEVILVPSERGELIMAQYSVNVVVMVLDWVANNGA